MLEEVHRRDVFIARRNIDPHMHQDLLHERRSVVVAEPLAAVRANVLTQDIVPVPHADCLRSPWSADVELFAIAPDGDGGTPFILLHVADRDGAPRLVGVTPMTSESFRGLVYIDGETVRCDVRLTPQATFDALRSHVCAIVARDVNTTTREPFLTHVDETRVRETRFSDGLDTLAFKALVHEVLTAYGREPGKTPRSTPSVYVLTGTGEAPATAQCQNIDEAGLALVERLLAKAQPTGWYHQLSGVAAYRSSWTRRPSALFVTLERPVSALDRARALARLEAYLQRPADEREASRA